MKKNLHILLLALGAAMVSSCVVEDLPGGGNGGDYRQSQVPVQAVPVLHEDWTPLTKAVSDITEIDNAGLQAEGFGVYAFYTGAQPFSADKAQSDYTDFGLVLNNRKFQYEAGSWENSGDAEFWPASSGENLSLFAYAPWDQWNDKVQYDGTNTKVPSIKYDDYVAQSLTESELSKQRDLLWGTNTSGMPHKNVEKDDYSPEGTVDFHFRHAVAKVRFGVRGSLPGVSRSFLRSEPDGVVDNSTSYSDGTPTYGSVQYTNGPITEVRRWRTGNGTRRDPYVYHIEYQATRTFTRTKTVARTERVEQTESAKNYYSYNGKKYLVESASFKGFYSKGTALLDNASAYNPSWTGQVQFGGSEPEYVLDGSAGNVLSPGLRYAGDATSPEIPGILEAPSDLMSGYFLYAIPYFPATEADRIQVNLKYHIMNTDYQVWVAATRSRVRTRSGAVTSVASYEETKTVENTAYYDYYYVDDANIYDFGFSNTHNFSDADYSSGSEPSYGEPSYEYGAWTESGDEHLSGAATKDFNDDPNDGAGVSLDGAIRPNLQGGYVYDITLAIAGDAMDLEVKPQPWDLLSYDFDYTANTNDVTQNLTYDSSTIDYADTKGNVYINNRMGKFYFQLGLGKYTSWRASLVGDAAFGFTDENGHFLLDAHGNRVSSVRGTIEKDVMNYLYIKAIDTEASVTSHAKLRIYLIDATGDAVVALNLVGQKGVTEWTIWQNAN